MEGECHSDKVETSLHGLVETRMEDVVLSPELRDSNKEELERLVPHFKCLV